MLIYSYVLASKSCEEESWRWCQHRLAHFQRLQLLTLITECNIYSSPFISRQGWAVFPWPFSATQYSTEWWNATCWSDTQSINLSYWQRNLYLFCESIPLFNVHSHIMIFCFWMVHLGRISCEIEERTDFLLFTLGSKSTCQKDSKRSSSRGQNPYRYLIYKFFSFFFLSAANTPVFMILHKSF